MLATSIGSLAEFTDTGRLSQDRVEGSGEVVRAKGVDGEDD